MFESTLVEIAVLAGVPILGVVVGWLFRGGRCAKEKIAISAGWQDQLGAQRAEHDRLAEQNKNLMEQISEYHASTKDLNLRAKELSDALKETFDRRDELQRQLKEVRGNLEVADSVREKLRVELESRDSHDKASASASREKDNKIFRLSRELTSWQNRVPPLVDRYRKRDLEAQQLGVELQQARDRIDALESIFGRDDTRIEPIDQNALADGLNASNDPLDGPPRRLLEEEPIAPDTSADGGSEEIEHASEEVDDTAEPMADPDASEEVDDTAEPMADPDASEEVDDTAEPIADPDASEEVDDTAEPMADLDASEEVDDTAEPIADLDASERPDTYLHVALTDSEAADRLARRAINQDASFDGGGPEGTQDALARSDANAESDATGRLDTDLHDDLEVPESDAVPTESQIGNKDTDDLKQIKGVGPAIEKTLNGLGIYRFNQIAEMSEYDIDRVAQHLSGFRSRIYREDWVGQARNLQYQKNNDLA
jgi:predicted flap endonuclease-1-like 5' DNA nuclease